MRRRGHRVSVKSYATAALLTAEMYSSSGRSEGARFKPLPDPQPGPQEMARNSKAQIIFYGGHAGSGKTWWLQSAALENYEDPTHRAYILRRTIKQAKKPGALCDESEVMYAEYGAHTVNLGCLHRFPSGATVSIGGCEHDKNRKDYDGSQLSFIGFDQVEQFTEIMFWYIALSRSRSISGIPTKIGATANPVPPSDETGGWLCKLLMDGGWVDKDTGYAIPGQSGVVKWFYTDESGNKVFFSSAEDAKKAFPEKAERGANPISMTFIEARLEDNAKLEEKDPNYRSNLESLPWMERQRLLGGNWKVSTAGGGIVRKEWIRRLFRDPEDSVSGEAKKRFWSAKVRAWDLAGSKNRPGKKAKDRTAGILCKKVRKTGRSVFSDPIARHCSPREVKGLVISTMLKDGPDVVVRLTQDPAQAGKDQAQIYVADLRTAAAEAGMSVPKIIVRPAPRGTSKGKGKLEKGDAFIAAAEPARVSADGEIDIHGNIDIIDGRSVDDALEELHHYTGKDGGADDYWDVFTDAFNQCEAESKSAGQIVY